MDISYWPVERTILVSLTVGLTPAAGFRNSIARLRLNKRGSHCERRSAGVQGHAVSDGEGFGSCFADHDDQLDGRTSCRWRLLYRQLVGNEDRFHFDWPRTWNDRSGFSINESGEETGTPGRASQVFEMSAGTKSELGAIPETKASAVTALLLVSGIGAKSTLKM